MSKIIDRIALFVLNRQFAKDMKRLEDIEMTYKLMKRIIAKGGYDHEETMIKLDVFLMFGRITAEEYQELAETMGGAGNE